MRETNFAMIREQLDETGRAYVRVTGTGMMPLLRPGLDRVIVDRTHYIHRGDIVLFDRKDGRYGLRRVLRTGKDGLSVAGDNRWHMVKVSEDRVLGKVSRIQREGRVLSRRKWWLKAYTFMATWLAYPRVFLGHVTGYPKDFRGNEAAEEKWA